MDLLERKMEETIKNLTKAFIGESMARNRYTFYAKIALNEGYDQVSEIFLLTADNEKEHAKWLLRLINDLKKKEGNQGAYDEIKVEAAVPTILGTTKENLKAAIEGENYENQIMYPDFSEIAEQEGLEEIAERLRSIAIAEKHHEERYRKILKEIEMGTFFKKEKDVLWICRKCGYVYKGKEPPEQCPSCNHERNYFQLKVEEY